MKDQTVYVLLGPTGSGKTSLVWDLNPELYEVVSCDSRQVYREMPVGTAMPDEKTKQRIPHHVIECLNPDETMDASRYSVLAKESLRDIFARGKLPVVVGGTGFYYMSLKTEAFAAPADPEIRNSLAALSKEERKNMLQEKDPSVFVLPGETTSAGKIHPHDDYRITRALEIFLSTGILWSEHWKKKKSQDNSEFYFTGWHIDVNLEEYKQQVLKRAGQMIHSGFAEEAVRISRKYGRDCPGMRSLGYREALDAAEGRISEEEFLQILGNLHYQYGRKQRTWFKREKELSALSIHAIHDILIEMNG